MLRHRAIRPLVFLLTVLAACQPGGPRSVSQRGADASVELLRARARQFSAAVVAASAAGWSGPALDSLVSLYTTEAVVFPPRGEPLRGRAAVRAYWTRPASRRILAHTITPERLDVSGTLGADHGRFEVVSQVGDSLPIRSTATYVSVWRREPDGHWRKHLDNWW